MLFNIIIVIVIIIFIVYEYYQMRSFMSSAATNTPTSTSRFIGEIIIASTSNIPDGFLPCDGQEVPQASYPLLYAAIGNTYGLPKVTTNFVLPDYRGVFLRGLDKGRGLDSGRAMGSAQADTVGSHVHPINDPGHGHPINDPGHNHGTSVSPCNGGWNGQGGGGVCWNNSSNTWHSGTGIGIVSQGTNITILTNSAGAETRPKNVSVVYAICAK
jgi:microcystin-dependent protein